MCYIDHYYFGVYETIQLKHWNVGFLEYRDAEQFACDIF